MYKHGLTRATSSLATWVSMKADPLFYLKWFKGLSDDLGENTFFSQFLSFIQKSMLRPDRNARVECKDVEEFLERCLGNKNSSYWLLDENLTEKYSLSRRSTESSSWSQD